VIGKYNKTYCSRNVKKLPTNYRVNFNSWMTAAAVEEFSVQLDHQIRTKKKSCSSLTNVLHTHEIPLF